MNRRAWTGVVAGVVAAFLLLGVAGTAYEIGQRHEVVTRTVGNGEVVRVVGDGWGGYGHGGFGFGFFLFPLLLIFLVFLAFRGRRGWYGGPGRYWGGGYGPCGPGSGGGFEEQHRRAHEQAPAGPGPGEPAVSAGPTEPGTA
jgi:hypothetical protein